MRLKNIFGGKEIPKGYAVVKVKDGTVPAKLTHNGHLVPREVKQDLHDKIKHAVKELGMKNIDVSRNAHGPALTLKIHPGQGRHDISVDITPSIPCKEPLTNNGWPRPNTRKAFGNRVIDDIKSGAGTHLVPKGDNVWAISYSKAENAALSKVDEGNGCRREVNRIMKKHVQDCTSLSKDGPGVSSHMIKHQVLWSAELHPDQKYWQ